MKQPDFMAIRALVALVGVAMFVIAGRKIGALEADFSGGEELAQAFYSGFSWFCYGMATVCGLMGIPSRKE